MVKTLYPTFQHWSSRGRVWVTSDTHFDDPDCKLMNPDWPHPMVLANRLNSPIGKQDTLVCLGDVGDASYIRHIHCRHKVLLLGNHDRGASYYNEWFDETYTGPLIVAEKLILSHEPVDLGGTPWAFNIHGHCHGHYNDLFMEPYHYNVAVDVMDWKPLNLGEFLKTGVLKNVTSLHRQTIDNAGGEKDGKIFSSC